jgi:hypothetical protein
MCLHEAHAKGRQGEADRVTAPNRGSWGRGPGTGASASPCVRAWSPQQARRIRERLGRACLHQRTTVRPSHDHGARCWGRNVSRRSSAWPHRGQRTAGVAGVESAACPSSGLGVLWTPSSSLTVWRAARFPGRNKPSSLTLTKGSGRPGGQNRRMKGAALRVQRVVCVVWEALEWKVS